MFRKICVTMCLAGVASPALASELAPIRGVSFAEVNFDNRDDVAVFYAKLKTAASTVCDSNSANPRITQMDKVCAQDALTKVVASMDKPLLTAMHARGSVRLASQ